MIARLSRRRLWAGLLRRVRRVSLRVRLVALGTVGLAVGLGVGGLALVTVLGFVVERTVDADALRTADDIARLVDAGALPQPAPVAGSQWVQVVDSDHRVRSASLNADRLVPLLREDELAKARHGRRMIVDGDRGGQSGPLRVVAVPAGPPNDPQTVIVALPLTEFRQSVGLLKAGLLVVYPMLLAGLALVGWRVVGAALHPVEELRAGAERITGAATAERLPVPLAHDEVHRLALTLNGMLDRLASARRRQRAFVSDAAHELRSPLASMRTQVEVARRLDGAADGHDELLADLLVDIERLSRLVNDLLLLARADEAGAAARAGRASHVDLADLVGTVVGRYHGARVPVTVIATAPAWTLAGPGELARVLTNLLDNAVRHAERRVTVTVAPGPYRHLVTVTDDGPGIPLADRERVFDRFTRLDDARTRDDGGAGLGLAIVRELLDGHGGTVTLTDARPGPGLSVEVRLRVAELSGVEILQKVD